MADVDLLERVAKLEQSVAKLQTIIESMGGTVTGEIQRNAWYDLARPESPNLYTARGSV